MKAFPLWSHASKSTGRTRRANVVLIFLAVTALLLIGGGQAAFGRYGLLAGFLTELALAALVVSYAGVRLSRLFISRELEGRDRWGAARRLEAIAQRAGIATPKAHVFECATPAAFSMGINRWDSAIFLSRALLDEFPPAELDAVLAHEVLRLSRQDAARLTLASALAIGFFGLGRLLDLPLAPLRFMTARAIRPGSALVAPLIFALQAPLDRPKLCYERDRETAALLGDARTLARVLWKLDSYCATRPFEIAYPDASLFLVNPLTQSAWYRYFILQPSAERRIRRLTGLYPL